MATGPHVSVIMSVYNGADYLYPCVQSILQQTFRHFEFLIMDDGSTDGSTEILRDMAKMDTRIRLVVRENRGLVASLNDLIELAKAPLLARMDCDDVAMPDRLRRQTEFLGKHPEIGILGCDTHDLDENGLLTGRGDEYPKDPSEAKIALKNGPPVCHPSVMMRIALIRKLGGYRQAFRHAQDYDLWLRASVETHITSLPERLLLYRRSPQQVSQKFAAEQAKGAAIAWLDHIRCCGGKNSLFKEVAELPEIDALDDHLGAGSAAFVRRKVVERMRYSNNMLTGPEFELMMEQVRGGNGFNGAGRTILRLGRKGRLVRAVILASAVTGLLLSSS
jgi:glycosyltransferase involved in cell wall biosynthesis